ncbi:hypothetical protein V8C26DRAFT_401524 [Trichoderma gracile]
MLLLSRRRRGRRQRGLVLALSLTVSWSLSLSLSLTLALQWLLGRARAAKLEQVEQVGGTIRVGPNAARDGRSGRRRQIHDGHGGCELEDAAMRCDADDCRFRAAREGERGWTKWRGPAVS